MECVEYRASPKQIVEYVASLKARQNVFRYGLIVYRLNSGETAEALAAEHGLTLEAIGEIVADWSDGSPGQEYLERQFAIHVKHYRPPPPPPSSREDLARRDEEWAQYEAAQKRRSAAIRAAHTLTRQVNAALGLSFPERNAKIVELRREGLTLSDIGSRFAVSPARVGQIILKNDRVERWRQIRVEHHLKMRHGRPLDMGGPRGVWIDYDLAD